MATLEKTCHARRAIVMAVFTAVPLLRPRPRTTFVARATCNPLGGMGLAEPERAFTSPAQRPCCDLSPATCLTGRSASADGAARHWELSGGASALPPQLVQWKEKAAS